MTICVCSPASPFARALGAMERGQLPREIDLEMLRGLNYGLGGKKHGRNTANPNRYEIGIYPDKS